MSQTTGRTTVVRLPETSGEQLRQALRATKEEVAPVRPQPVTQAPVPPQPVIQAPLPPQPVIQAPAQPKPEEPVQQPRVSATPATEPRKAAARWLSLNQAAVMSGVPERTLRGWATSKTPQDVPVRPGDPRFLLIRSPGPKLADGLWMVDGPGAPVLPATVPPSAAVAEPKPLPAAASVPRPDLAERVVEPPSFEPPAVEVRPAEQPASRAPRGPALSEDYLSALLAREETLSEMWGFDTAEEERKGSRRHKILVAVAAVLGFAGVAEIIDFLMSHVLR